MTDTDLKAAAIRLMICEYNAEGFMERDGKVSSQVMDGHFVARALLKILAEHPADDDEPVTEEWLKSIGFLPNENPKGVARKIWDRFGETDWGDESAMHLLYTDSGFWLETYDRQGDSLCMIELVPKKTRGQVRLLCRALGIELKGNP